MHALTSSDIDEIEAMLRKERDGLLDTVRLRLGEDGLAQAAGTTIPAGEPAGQLDDMPADADVALLAEELEQLHAIDGALKRIEFGVGGLCIECGMPIPITLLRLTPAAATCAACGAVPARR